MEHPKFIVSNQKEESIITLSVKIAILRDNIVLLKSEKKTIRYDDVLNIRSSHLSFASMVFFYS